MVIKRGGFNHSRYYTCGICGCITENSGKLCRKCQKSEGKRIKENRERREAMRSVEKRRIGIVSE